MQTGDERALLAALAEGDRSAADRLVDLTYRRIYAALFRLTGGDGETAADLTQEAYRKAWASLSGFRGQASFSTWLYRIAYTTFLNHVRRPRALLPLDDAGGDELPDPERPPDEIAGASEDSERLRRAVLALPDDLRFTVTARYWSGLSVSRIAELEEITPVAIRKRLKRAHGVLALALEEGES